MTRKVDSPRSLVFSWFQLTGDFGVSRSSVDLDSGGHAPEEGACPIFVGTEGRKGKAGSDSPALVRTPSKIYPYEERHHAEVRGPRKK